MKVTLYKNCKLTDNYNYVFDLTPKTATDGSIYTALSSYLKTLESTVIELPNLYYSQNMQFTFRIEGDARFSDAYSYNYCKIEVEDLIRYCFIDDITLANTVATYSTSEDIWSNYAYKMTLNYGYLTNSKKLSYTVNGEKRDINYRLLPTAYQSNDKPVFESVAGLSTNIDYSICAQLQVYDLGTGGEITNRYVKTVIFTLPNESLTSFNATFYLGNVTDILTKLQVLSSTASLLTIFGDKTKLSYFQIDNITILPRGFGVCRIVDDLDVNQLKPYFVGSALISNSEVVTFFDLPALIENYEHRQQGEFLTLLDKVLPNDYKVISFGTRTGQYELNMNGTPLNFALKLACTDWSFKLVLEFQEKCIDITNDFVIKVPFDAITGDVQAQRTIAKNTAIYNGISNIVGGVAKVGYSAASVASGSVTEMTRIAHPRKTGKVTSRKTTKQGTISDRGEGAVSGILEIADGIVGIVNATTPQYTSNRGTFVETDAMINVWHGLCYQVIAPDNEQFVNDMIDLVGYIVYEVIKKDIIFNQSFEKSDTNVLKFESVVLSGEFPLAVKDELQRILTNGFIIEY